MQFRIREKKNEKEFNKELANIEQLRKEKIWLY